MRVCRDLLIAIAAATFVIAALAANPDRVPIVALLLTHTPVSDPNADVLRAALLQLGYRDGKDIRLEVRSALGHIGHVQQIAEQLVALKPEVIIVVNEIALRAATHSTSSIPIVMVGYTATDPVAMGLVKTYSRPGGNVTGVFSLDSQVLVKRLEILKEALPNVSEVGVLWDPTFGRRQLTELEYAAKSLGLHLLPLEVQGPEQLERAFQSARHRRAGLS